MIALILLTIVVVCIFTLARNNWVYKKRMEILMYVYDSGDMSEYDSLPSYNSMMFRYFWIWDIESLKNIEEKQ